MRTEVTSVTTRPHPISNTFHLIMTICTCGLWAPVWWFMARGHKVTTRGPVTAFDSGGNLPPGADLSFDVSEMRARGATSKEIRKAVVAEAQRRAH